MNDLTDGIDEIVRLDEPVHALEVALDDLGHAINEAEGNDDQAALNREVARSISEAMALLGAATLDDVVSPLERLRLTGALATLVKEYRALGDDAPLDKLKLAVRVRDILAQLGQAVEAASAAPVPAEEPDTEGEKQSAGRHYDFDPGRKHAQRKKDNTAAMKVLADVESGAIDPESLTDEQKATLAKYSGTGGALTGADGKKGSFFEYYTPKPIAAGMWDMLRELGFQGGKVLDPSAGTGIFGATAPDDAIVDAVELDQTSGKINRLLNSGPGNNVEISNFEKVAASTPDETYDAIITNVPFGDTKARGGNELDDPRYQKEPLENYFVLRSLEKLRPGGLAAFITPPRVVSGKGGRQEDLRVRVSYMAEFMGAYRLPNSVFGTADADTITDVIVFRKYSRPVLDKIEELREQSPATLVEANVVWSEFVSGKYFVGEGRRFMLGEFQAKNPNKIRDVDRVIHTGSVADIAKLLRKFPGSRVKWDVLEAAETAPIVYQEGDTIAQRGQTLQYRAGTWVALQSNEANADMLKFAVEVATPLDAFTHDVTYVQAGKYLKYMNETAQALDIPGWLRDAFSALARLSGDSDRARYWRAGVVGLSVAQVLDAHSGEPGFNYLEEYPALSEAMQRSVSDAKSCPGAVGGQLRAGMKTLQAHYGKKAGFSGVWRGEYVAEQADVRSEDQKFEAAKYASQSVWVSREEAAKLYGDAFDPIADPAWCISDDGKQVARADDYFVGNYGETLAKLDRAAAAATDETVRGKLLAMRQEAENRVERIDVSKVSFNLFSPYVKLEDKAEFLRRFMSPDFVVAYDEDTGQPYIEWAGKKSDNSTRAKLLRRFAIYLKNGTVTLGGAQFVDDREALAALRDMIRTANEQIDGWARANPLVLGALQERANDPARLRFRQIDDETPLPLPGLSENLVPHGYQYSFIRRMGRSFGGLNGFGVGLGKTLTALASVQHAQNIGVKKKTAFVVPNSVLSNWHKESGRVYTNMEECLFVGLTVGKGGEAKVDSGDYDRDLNIVRENRHRKIFMTFEAFQRLRLKDETISAYEGYLRSVDASFAESEDRKADTIAEGNTKRLSAMLTDGKTAATPYLEDLGIDSLVIDEAHAYKNSAETIGFKSAKFLSLPESSARGVDAQAKTWYIRGLSPLGDGVLGLTATPLTNSPLEIYSMLSLVVGRDQVNDMAMGVRGADGFMEAVAHVETEEDESIDGIMRETRVFHGLNNVQIIRKMLGDVAVIKDAESVGAQIVQPEADEIATPVALPEPPVIEMLQKYKGAFRYAIDALKERDENRGDPDAFREVSEKFGEPLELIGHPFNLINKMSMLIMDSELDERVTYYTFIEGQADKAKKVVAEFNAKKYVEERARPGPHTREEDIVGRKTRKDGDDKIELIKVQVNARIIGNRILIDTTTHANQMRFESMADKAGLDLDVSVPPKLAALMENFIKEETNPRGIDAEGNPSPKVKQLIFCDMLPLHAKIRRMLIKRAGVPANAIVFVTGQTNGKPDEILDVQDGFNASGEDNKYRVVIANEKAEVGINLQIGTQAIHHLTMGWTPDSKTQRDGRGVRQGNRTARVNVYTYDADGTFDSAKRAMVNKKSSWIEEVMDVNGGENVTIQGGLTREQLESLIDTVGDADAMTRLQERIAEKDREVRAAGTRAKQIVNLRTVESASKFIADNPSIRVWAARKAAEYYAIKRQIDELRRRIANPKATATAIVKNETLLAERMARANGLARLFDDAVTFTRNGVRQSLDGLIAEATAYVKRGEDPQQKIVSRISNSYGLEAVENEDSELGNEWRSEIDMSKSLISTAKASYTKGSKADGGLPPEIMEQYAAGNGTLFNGVPVVNGSFVRMGDELGVTYERGTRVLFRRKDGTYARMASYSDLKGHETILPGTPGYDDVLTEAARLDDLRAGSGEALSQDEIASLFSSRVPDVSKRRTNAGMVLLRQYEDLLSPPYFPYVLNPDDAGKGETYARIIKQQAAVVARFGDNDGRKRGDGYDYYAVPFGVETSKRVGGESIRETGLKALFAFAGANGLRLSKGEIVGLGGSAYSINKLARVGDSLESVLVKDGKPAFDTPEALREATRKWLSESIPYLDTGESWSDQELGSMLTYAESSALRSAITVIEKAREAENQPATMPETDEPAKRPDTPVVVGGNTFKWKDELKQVAKDNGERAHYNDRTWTVSQLVWDKFAELYPAALQPGQLVIL